MVVYSTLTHTLHEVNVSGSSEYKPFSGNVMLRVAGASRRSAHSACFGLSFIFALITHHGLLCLRVLLYIQP